MKYGREDGKKIILKTDISGNIDQEDLWAILDGVGSEDEEDLDNLIVGSDTEFEPMSDDARRVLETVTSNSQVPLLTSNCLKAIIRDPPTQDSSVPDEPVQCCSKLLPDSSEQGVDFTNHSSRIQKIKCDETRKTLKKEKTISNVEKQSSSGDAGEIISVPQTSVTKDLVPEKRKKKKEKEPSINTDNMKWSKRKLN